MAIALVACVEMAQLPRPAGIGSHPQAPPQPALVRKANIAPAVGWPAYRKPIAAPGMSVKAFASGLEHPHRLYVLPNGDVLVTETYTPAKPEIKTRAMQPLIDKAGVGVASAIRITLLRDTNSDGVADIRTVFLKGLNSPFGMALIGNDFYVANANALVKFPYQSGATHIVQPGLKILDLPAGPINDDWTKNLLASRDGQRLYVTIGSNRHAAEHGIDNGLGRAMIWEVALKSGGYHIYPSGLSNPNGLAWELDNGTSWTVANGRDGTGTGWVPDYLASVTNGSFFGWPYSYFGRPWDEPVQPQRPGLLVKASVPNDALASHSASLGLVFTQNTIWPVPFKNGFFIGQYGSWNREPRSGYRVIFVPFRNGKPYGLPLDVLTGFINSDGGTSGRPIGIIFDKQSALLVADSVGNTVWRVTYRSSDASLNRRPE